MAVDGLSAGHDVIRFASVISAVVKSDLVALVSFLGVPFKCKEDVIPNNKQVLLCQVGTAVEPEDVSIFEGVFYFCWFFLRFFN